MIMFDAGKGLETSLKLNDLPPSPTSNTGMNVSIWHSTWNSEHQQTNRGAYQMCTKCGSVIFLFILLFVVFYPEILLQTSCHDIRTGLDRITYRCDSRGVIFTRVLPDLFLCLGLA